MSAFMGKRASLPNRPSLAVDEAKAATRLARQGRAARQTAALEACLDGLQRELEAARLVEQGARQELEDQRAAILEEKSRFEARLASFRRDVEGSCTAQRLVQAEAEAQHSLAQQDAAELGARLQELQGSADAARDEQEKRHSVLVQAAVGGPLDSEVWASEAPEGIKGASPWTPMSW